ncbi:MAG: helix-turn-helix domain-containing protein [Nitrososphaerota archaeon]|nr:helix-turn-helix domain-containing protein [Candidatus Geocrenenecus dongiae]
MSRSLKGRKSSSSRLPIEDIEYVEDFGRLIRDAREKMGLTQEELANQLNERVTIIKKIEAGEFKPSIELARRIEKLLKIKIIVPSIEEDLTEISKYLEKKKAGGVTLGELLGEDKEKSKR